MPRKTVLSLLAAPVFLAGCMNADCSGDPRLASLATSAACTFGGGFEAETQRQQAMAQASAQQAAALQQRNAALNRQAASLTAQQRQLDARLARVNDQTASLQRQLDERLAQQRMTQADYDLAVRQLDNLNAQRARLSPADPQAAERIQALEAEIAELEALLQ